MLPRGMEVRRKPKTGAFVLDADGRVCVKLQELTNDRPMPMAADKSSPSGRAATMDHQQDVVAADEAVAKALKLSEAAPDSMKFFSEKNMEDVDGKDADGTSTFLKAYQWG